VNALRIIARLLLGVFAAFALIPVWLWLFEMFHLPEWSFFHSGLPLFIVGGATYWQLGRWRVFRGGAREARTPPR
jgi:hypothetical protein